MCRAETEYSDLAAATKEDRVKAAEATAENRVLIATVRAMQEECHTCKVCQPFGTVTAKGEEQEQECCEKL